MLAVTLLIVGFLCITAVDSGFARSGKKPVADVMISSSGINWIPNVNYSQLTVSISTPDGTVFTRSFESGAAPYVNISEMSDGQYLDGSYTYEIRVVPVNINKRRADGDAQVHGQVSRRQEPLTQTGYFTVQGGAIVVPTDVEATPGRPGAGVSPAASTANDGISRPMDQVILDDLIVDGSICVGFDCINGESFGFDTLRLKENNLRIKFQDTSTSATFPSNDWQITANDSTNGGANKFSIDDIDGGRTPFTIEAGAPSNSLYVDDGGRLGFGTSTPVAQLHVKDGNTPTLRLEQDGSSGFTAQTWDIAGNEANFFIRDATNGSTLPFRIIPGAPSNSVYIDSIGRVGFGTNAPGFPLHIKASSAATFGIERDGGAIAKITAGTDGVQFGSNTAHKVKIITNNGTTAAVFDTTGYAGIGNFDNTVPSYPLEMKGGAYSTGTTWEVGSSREYKENIENLTTAEAVDALEGLIPVKFHYKNSQENENVGFIAEDVPELVASKGRKGLSSMDIVAVLTKVVKEQQKMVTDQQQTIAELKKEIEALKKK
jgi:hypothetical protein